MPTFAGGAEGGSGGAAGLLVESGAAAKLSALTAVVTPADADLLYLVQSATSKKMTLAQAAAYMANGGLNGEVTVFLPAGTAAATPGLKIGTEFFIWERGGAYTAFGDQAAIVCEMNPNGWMVKPDRSLGFFDAGSSGAVDSAISRPSFGVFSLDTDSKGNALGAVRLSREVEANTAGIGAPNVLLASESNKTLTNEGATAENYHTLPAAAAGGYFVFHVVDTDGIRITAGAGDTIQAGTAAASAAAGFIRCATVGACIALKAVNATAWVTESIVGTWTVDA